MTECNVLRDSLNTWELLESYVRTAIVVFCFETTAIKSDQQSGAYQLDCYGIKECNTSC